MRTKILSTAAAALALGLVSSHAQVYSANVVGYYNVPIMANQPTMVGNQLINSTSNDLNAVLGSLPNKSTVNTWDGTAFTLSTKTASGWSPDQTLAVGQGFFVKTPSNATNTFVGSVAAAPGGSVTNSLTGGIPSMVASAIPYAEDMNGTNINLSALPNKSTINTWDGTAFTLSTKTASGWSPDQTISVGQGFYVKPASTADWVQTLPSN